MNKWSDSFKDEVFQWHYGSAPMDVAEIWFDLQAGEIPGASLNKHENSIVGFKRFMMAHFYLWVYPKNAGLIATRFGMCKTYCQGEHLHKWIRKIAALCEKKIKWDPDIGREGSSKWVCSIDCTDVRTWEKRHHFHLNVDRTLWTKKFNSAGLKYEIVLNITKSKCMSIVGPQIPSKTDMDLFREHTKEKVKAVPGGMAITDSIYKPGENYDDEDDLCAIPSSVDTEALSAFKSRVCARHESFNGRIKKFSFLCDTYRSVDYEKHGHCFRAICVIVQYQMDNGSPLFSVH